MKKKLIISLLLLTCLFMCISLGAWAESYINVIDDVGILSSTERQQLEYAARDVTEQYGCEVFIYVTEDYSLYSNGNIEEFAEETSEMLLMDSSREDSCILLVLSMAERDYDIACYGDIANTAFTDYAKELLADSFLGEFKYDNWFGGFSDYIITAADFLQQAADGRPVDDYSQPESGYSFSDIMIIILVPCIIALIVCNGFKAQMKTANLRSEAASYVSANVLQISRATDHFMYQTRSVQKIESNSSSGGTGRGTSVNSGGFSHRSGKF